MRNHEPNASGYRQIPVELRRLRRWLTWRLAQTKGGRATKKPDCSTRDAESLREFDDVAQTPLTKQQGIGLCLTGGASAKGYRVIGLDLDACYFDGKMAAWAEQIFERSGRSYTEVSPSGTGLRIFALVKDAPPYVPKIPINEPVPGDKKPEIQVFGCGAAQYVTVTGQRLTGSLCSLVKHPDLEWLLEPYADKIKERPIDRGEIPTGTGPRPGPALVRQRVGSSSTIAALIEGRWEGKFPSASEGYRELARAALRASRGHVEAARAFLMDQTAYGRGDVDSREPERYQREEWVLGDLCRIAAQENLAANPFADDFDVDGWTPPARGRKDANPEGAAWIRAVRTDVPPTRFVVSKFLPARGTGYMIADPGVGKSTIAVSLATHIAAGAPWCGRNVVRPGKVVYICGEDLPGVENRVRAAGLDLGLEDPVQAGRIWVSTRGAALMEPENVNEWCRQIREVREEEPVSMVVVDTLERNFGPGNESDTDDVRQFLDGVAYISRALRTFVLVVHHMGHQDKSRARGHSAIGANADVTLIVRRIPKTPRHIEILTTKAKNWEAPEPVRGAIEAVDTGGRDEEGNPTTVAVFRGISDLVGRSDMFADEISDPVEKRIYEVIEMLGEFTGGIRKLADQVQASKSSVSRKLQNSIDRGLITKVITKRALDGTEVQAVYRVT